MNLKYLYSIDMNISILVAKVVYVQNGLYFG